MTTLEYLDRWRSTGAVTTGEHAVLTAIVRKERFPVFLELNALLYLGVLAFIGGLGWTVREHFASLGDVAVLAALATVFGGSVFYCFGRAQPYTPERVESPTFAFDYVLYLGCLAFGVGLGYLEFRYQFLASRWDTYLLASAILYFFFAYRFDNRFVLSLALSTLAGWFGVRISMLNVADPIRLTRGLALAYGVVVAMAGVGAFGVGIKAHFIETYLHIAANAILAALLSGAIVGDRIWLAGLLVASGLAIQRGIRFKRFAFVAYGVVYAYIGLSAQLLRGVNDDTAVLGYFIVSGTIVIVALAVLSRRFGREE